LVDEETNKVTDLSVKKPDWLRMWIQDPNELRYKIETSDNDYAGKYKLRVEAHFADRYWLPSALPTTPPTLDIDLEIYSNLIQVGPQGGIALEDQEINVYEDLFYPVNSKMPDCPKDTYPTIEVFESTAKKFLTWN
jgi:hypothetical protein